MAVKIVYKVRPESTTGVIYISFPELGWEGVGAKGSGLNIFHYQVGYNYRNWGTHGCTMDLLVEGVTKGKIGGIETKF